MLPPIIKSFAILAPPPIVKHPPDVEFVALEVLDIFIKVVTLKISLSNVTLDKVCKGFVPFPTTSLFALSEVVPVPP